MALTLALGACYYNNYSNEDKTNQSLYLPYEIDNTGCIKRFYANENNSVNVIIPATYSIDAEGKIISGEAYEVKTIGEYCFANNKLIETVFIPDTITKIEECAFYNCSKINTVNISKNIHTVGQTAFEECPKLTTITKNGKSGLIIDDNKNLHSFFIPNSITKIEEYAFSNWTNLTSIIIGSNIEYIGDYSFSNCGNLSNVDIISSLTYLGNNTFADCEKLTALTTSQITNGLCMAPNQRLRNFVVPATIQSIKEGFFYGWKQLEELYIPEKTTLIGMIFKDNDCLKKLSCGSSNILSLFYHRPNYETVIESEKMYMVSYRSDTSSYAYNYYIPNTLTEVNLLNNIESYCLYGMKSIKTVYIQSTVSDFGYGAFAECSGLTNVYFTTDRDWIYSMSYYNSSDQGTVSKADMNNSVKLAALLKEHNGLKYRRYKS